MNLKIRQFIIEFSPLYHVYFNKQFLEFSSIEKADFVIKSELKDSIHVKGDLLYDLPHFESIYQQEHGIQIVKHIDGMIHYAISKKNNEYTIYINRNVDQKAELEYVLSARCFSHIVSQFNHLVLHASAITWNNHAILFSSSSGIGKTTLAKRVLSSNPQSKFINDDKPLITVVDDIVYASGTPWAGSEGLCHPIEAQIQTILFIEQGDQPKIIQMTNQEKIVKLIEHTQRLFGEHQIDQYMQIIESMIEHIQIYRFVSSNSDDDYKIFEEFMRKI